MKTFGLVMRVIVFVMWIAGMIAAFYSPGLALMLWSFPAGWGAGATADDLIERYNEK